MINHGGFFARLMPAVGRAAGAKILLILMLGFMLMACSPARGGEATTVISPVSPPPAAGTPLSAKALFEQGNTYYEAGQLDQAIKTYRAVIELDPGYQPAYANLGVVYYQQNNFELAASQYEKALELNPNDGDVAYNLGVLYLQQALTKGQKPDARLLEKAVTQLKQAQKISPKLTEPLFSLGVAYFALEQRDQAIKSFESYLAANANPDSRAKQEAEHYLKLLKGQK